MADYEVDVFHDTIAHGTAADLVAHFEPFVDAGMEHLVFSNVGPLAGVEFLGPSSSTLKEAAALLRS